ncbi:hypothetical protein LZ554_004394 [Drepanopeziza brunnea f. sp. 'monogermtubi']|nr:hypothetical protein LZ554_004394 [Drepanopeziza brunnea f. sp. 'monogermtubi']
MHSNNGGISRSSSATLSMAPRPSSAIFDDINIAQGLLNEPKDPRHRSSMTSINFSAPDGSDDQAQTSVVPADGHPGGREHRIMRSSNTWTSSSGDVLSDHDEVDDRTIFVHEYNRLARKHGVRPINPEDYDVTNDELINASAKPGSWFSRKILRKTSSSQSVKLKAEKGMKHRRSFSDLSLRLKLKKDKLKDKDLRELVRLCGSSLLYLPTEYAAGSLSVPTCFRATAQYLVQHGKSSLVTAKFQLETDFPVAPTTRGVFRVPGSQNVVAALYNHYGSMDEDGQVVSGTVRCPTLPEHIRCDVHDVGSAFKKFLSGLPGGILGSLHLFNALISIQGQLRGDPELTRTKQSKVRARLIALAIATLRSQYRRELICAVFGLLSMIGRAAEIAPRENERGQPLPTSDLMGYGPLGIIFGPLLVGDLLEDHTMRIANPQGGLVLLPVSPPKSRKERQKKNKAGEAGIAFDNHVDKIKVANSIAEMLITHWRDVVRHMRNLGALKIVVAAKSMTVRGGRQPMLRPSASESFALRKPPDWDNFKSPIRRQETSVSPTPTPRRINVPLDHIAMHPSSPQPDDMLVVKKQRSKAKPMLSQRLSVGRSLSILSPTAEEYSRDDQSDTQTPTTRSKRTPKVSHLLDSGEASSSSAHSISNPAKDGFYSPSTPCEDGTHLPDASPLGGPRDDADLDLMLKENTHPRQTLSTALPSGSPRPNELAEQSSKQQLHFMSTPVFSHSSPRASLGKSLRKKSRISKESSSSSDKAKIAVSQGSPRKLQKQSQRIMDRGRGKLSPGPRPLQPMAHISSPRDAAVMSEYAALTAEIDVYHSDSVAHLREQDKQTFKQQKPALDAEFAVLKKKFEALQAEKCAPEESSSSDSGASKVGAMPSKVAANGADFEVCISKSEAILAEKNLEAYKQQKVAFEAGAAVLEGKIDMLETIQAEKAVERPTTHEAFAALNRQPSSGSSASSHGEATTAEDKGKCSSRSHSSRWHATPISEKRKAADFSGKMASNKNEFDNFDYRLQIDSAIAPQIDGSHVVAENFVSTARRAAPEAGIDAIDLHTPPKHFDPESKAKKLGFEIGAQSSNIFVPLPDNNLRDETCTESDHYRIRTAKRQSPYKAHHAVPFAHQYVNGVKVDKSPALSSSPLSSSDLSEESHVASKNRDSETRDISAEYAAFMKDAKAFKARYDATLADTKSPGYKSKKRVLDKEMDALDARWKPIKTAMDSGIKAKGNEKLSTKTSSFTPFDHLGTETKSRPSIYPLGSPKITIFRTSSGSEDGKYLRVLRRIGGSDPGLQLRARSFSPRRVSRSLYEHPKRIKNVLPISRLPRDPLLRASHESDDASLAILAQALATGGTGGADDIPNQEPKSNTRSRNHHHFEEKEIKQRVDHSSVIPSLGSEEGTEASTSNPSRDLILRGGMFKDSTQHTEADTSPTKWSYATTNVGTKLEPTFQPRPDVMVSLPMQVPKQSSVDTARPHLVHLPAVVPKILEKKPVSGIPLNTPEGRGKKSPPQTPANSPAKDASESPSKQSKSSSKISLLVARFNSGGRSSPPLVSASSAKSSPAKSPTKTPPRPGTPETKAGVETYKGSIVAPYTSNPASPTKSQKSDKTPQSIRAAGGETVSVLDPKRSPVRKATPKRILRESLKDSTPLRSVGKTVNPSATPSPPKATNPYAVSLRPVRKSVDGSPTRGSSNSESQNSELSGAHPTAAVAKPKGSLGPEPTNTILVFPATTYEATSVKKPETAFKQTPPSPVETIRRIRQSGASGSSIDHVSVYAHGIHLKPAAPVSSGEQSPDFPGFDGPAGASNIGRVLPRPDLPPVAQHLQLSRPPTASTVSDLVVFADHPEFRESGLNPPPGRSSSLLYNQVRTLQRQLADKIEEIQHLKQQLNARENLEIGTLSEELRETKRDMQSWKARAEVAEKQLEIVMKMPSRNNSLKHAPSNVSRRSERLERTSTDSRREEGTMAERIRKALHGLDGTEDTESPTRWSSGDSTNTVIRDLQGVVLTGSDYSSWMEQPIGGDE